jgi:UDP-2-acetamido-2-deoxy-ribo-hexuluronate aminotransferase
VSASIALVDLPSRHARTAETTERAVAEVMRSGHYIGGPVVERVEGALAALHGRAHAVGVASGTDALILGLLALGVTPGDQVLVPAVSFFATAGAVLSVGAVPVVVDVLRDRPLADWAAAPVGRQARAVIPVHLFGDRAPEPALGLPVLDDAAQAIGRSLPGGEGRLAAMSFYPTKVLGAAGDGGAVLTDDAALADRVRALGHHGHRPDGGFARVEGATGRNSRLGAVQAAVLDAALPDLPARLARRRAIAATYDAEIGGGACVDTVPRDAESPVSVFCVRHPHRDRLAEQLAAAGVQTRVYYPRPLSHEPALAHLPRVATPNADRFCNEALALPCHVSMTDDDVARVVDAIRSAS